ncbi:hypothetical protein B0H10DRAFT_1952469 [Mycena sp. CBHHK59/15]|nr:hypothetical protein B0H10DRAFT_1952469 [Mycena sp. CBHHK59/15]
MVPGNALKCLRPDIVEAVKKNPGSFLIAVILASEFKDRAGAPEIIQQISLQNGLNFPKVFSAIPIGANDNKFPLPMPWGHFIPDCSSDTKAVALANPVIHGTVNECLYTIYFIDPTPEHPPFLLAYPSIRRTSVRLFVPELATATAPDEELARNTLVGRLPETRHRDTAANVHQVQHIPESPTHGRKHGVLGILALAWHTGVRALGPDRQLPSLDELQIIPMVPEVIVTIPKQSPVKVDDRPIKTYIERVPAGNGEKAFRIRAPVQKEGL